MTKAEFMKHVAAIYACGNRSDNEGRHEHAEKWTRPDMAGLACCAPLDSMLREMENCGALTSEERQAFYDNM